MRRYHILFEDFRDATLFQNLNALFVHPYSKFVDVTRRLIKVFCIAEDQINVLGQFVFGLFIKLQFFLSLFIRRQRQVAKLRNCIQMTRVIQIYEILDFLFNHAETQRLLYNCEIPCIVWLVPEGIFKFFLLVLNDHAVNNLINKVGSSLLAAAVASVKYEWILVFIF